MLTHVPGSHKYRDMVDLLVEAVQVFQLLHQLTEVFSLTYALENVCLFFAAE